MSRIAVGRPNMKGLRLSPTLTVYIARTFVGRFLTLLGAIAGVILLATTIEELDELGSGDQVTLLTAGLAALLKLPRLAQEVMPFAVLFGGMATFWRLTRTHELVVARAAGMSVWQLLAPALAVSVLIGVATTTLLNPISAVMLRHYDRLAAQYSGDQDSTLSISENGLWLRQNDGNGQSVIHASRVRQSDMTLFDVTVFRFAGESDFESRIDAERAKLDDGRWILQDALLTEPGREGRFLDRTTLKTDLSPDKIYKSFSPPETISFWELPDFIDLLANAGFAAEPHRLQYHRLLAKPVLLAAMILLAAAFSLRPHRRGGVVTMVVAGVLTGFLVYVLSNIVFAMGLSSKLPVVMAAWTPGVVSLMLGSASLFHLEDG